LRVGRMQEEQEVLEGKLSQRELHIQHLEREVAEQRGGHVQLKADLALRNEDLQRMRAQLSESESLRPELRRHQEQLAETLSKRHASESEKARLQERLKALEAQHEKDRATWQAQVQSSQNDAHNLQSDLSKRQVESRSWESERTKLEQRVMDLQHQLQTVTRDHQRENSEFSGGIEHLRAAYSELQSQLALAQSRLESVQNEKADLQALAARVTPLGTELQREQARMRELERELERTSIAHQRETEAYLVESSGRRAISQRLEASEKRVSHLQSENDSLRHAANARELELQRLKHQPSPNAELERRIHHWEAEYRLLQARTNERIANQEHELESLNARLAAFTAPWSGQDRRQTSRAWDGLERRSFGARMASAARRQLRETKDDLKMIYGIGPVLERSLNRMGITTFKQIAQWTPRDIEAISTKLEAFRDRILRDNWVDGARKLHMRTHGESI
jgi:predicted flap endonuclease-1-like 5' DNA nuclease